MGKMQSNHNKQLKTLARSDETSPTVIFLLSIEIYYKIIYERKKDVKKIFKKIQTNQNQ